MNILDGTVYSLATALFQTRVQEEAPPEILGRIFAVFYAFEEMCSIVGMLLGGWIATVWGVIAGFRTATILSFVVIGVAFVMDIVKDRLRANNRRGQDPVTP